MSARGRRNLLFGFRSRLFRSKRGFIIRPTEPCINDDNESSFIVSWKNAPDSGGGLPLTLPFILT